MAQMPPSWLTSCLLQSGCNTLFVINTLFCNPILQHATVSFHYHGLFICTTSLTPSDPALVGQEMPANAARNDGKPSFEDPTLIKMSNQHSKLGQARSEESASTKLNEQDNTHAVPVCALMAPARTLCRDVLGRGVHREPHARFLQ